MKASLCILGYYISHTFKSLEDAKSLVPEYYLMTDIAFKMKVKEVIFHVSSGKTF